LRADCIGHERVLRYGKGVCFQNAARSTFLFLSVLFEGWVILHSPGYLSLRILESEASQELPIELIARTPRSI